MRVLLPLLLAGVLTLANALKPVTVDDAAYLTFAKHIAQHPDEPYDFIFNWYQQPQRAFEILAPPVVPYWLAAGIALGGDAVVWLKLWMFPFCWLLACAVFALARRFAGPVAVPLTILIVLSPPIVPSVNLMLDVPALALALTALGLFIRGTADPRERRYPLVYATLAGLVGGLAMQTKYTAFTLPAAMLVYALLLLLRRTRAGYLRRRRLADGLRGLTVALPAVVGISFTILTFLAIERQIQLSAGDSHFLYHANRAGGADLRAKLWANRTLALPLAAYLGGLAPALIVLLLRGWWRWVVIVLVVGWIAAVGLVPESSQVFVRDPDNQAERLTLNSLWTGSVAVLLVLATLTATARLGFRPSIRWLRLSLPSWFLLIWLLGEVLAYFLLTPFPAARRVLGVYVVLALLLGRAAAVQVRLGQRSRRSVWPAVALSLGLAGFFAAVDILDADVERQAIHHAVEWIKDHDQQTTLTGGPHRIWFTGHWGMQWYGEQAGLKHVWPERADRVLMPPDWLIVPELRPHAQEIELPADAVGEPVWQWSAVDPVPYRTIWPFYGGRTPLEHRDPDQPRMRLKVYRIQRELPPRTPGLVEPVFEEGEGFGPLEPARPAPPRPAPKRPNRDRPSQEQP
jgi:hypothetical protein